MRRLLTVTPLVLLRSSMIAWAGLGVAIEGSPEEVQAAADRTIPGPGNGGIKQLADLLLRS